MKKDWIARQLRAEVIVGTFVLLVFLGLGYFTIILSRDAWFAPRFSMDVIFTDVLGLRDGDTVVVRGMTIGKVQRLELKPEGVHVIMALEQEPHLREGCLFKVIPSSILGGRYLEIDEGPKDAPKLSGDTQLHGEKPNDLIGDAADVMAALKTGMIEGGIVSNFQAAADNMRILTDRIEAGQGTLGRLMATNDQVYADLAATIGSLREITGRLEGGQGTLGKLMSTNDDVYANLAASAASVREITARLEAGDGSLGKLLAKDDQVYDDLAATMKSLRSVSEKIDTGEGVIGKLVSDKEMGVKVEQVLDEVMATVDDLREASPVATFTSIFFGAL